MAVDACPTCGEPLEKGECLWHGPPDDPNGPDPIAPRKRRRNQATLYVQAAIITTLVFAVGGVVAMVVDDSTAGGGIATVNWVDPYAQPGEEEDPEQLRRAVEKIEASGRVVVSSEPPGADVYSGIRKLGNTPLRMERPEKSERMDLRISKAGFNDSRLTVSKDSPLRLHVRLSRGAGVKEK
ncbi:MAG: PEGA domain-containing protein [Deltaproteobacteria bacterium]|nr:PEGA domain-containing protein [Deltaproteobacteria bacterium]